MKFGKLIGVIEVCTSSVRFSIFVAGTDRVICSHQTLIQSIQPQDGWCEQDPMDIIRASIDCMYVITRRMERLGASETDVVAIGVTNQCETTIVWDKKTGKPLYNAVIWWDNRATNTVNLLIESISNDKKGENMKMDFLRPLCGLPLSPYFPAGKLRWLKDNVPKVRKAMQDGHALFGTIDSWLIYNLTGATNGGIHITDVTNASRTMLMNLSTLKWDPKLLEFFGLSSSILPEILSNAEIYGIMSMDHFKGVQITSCLGKQQAALIGHQCLRYGQLKASFGTGCSVLFNTANQIIHSSHGLLTTVGYQLGRGKKAVYALEGNCATAGDAFTWLRDQMGLINTVNEIESMARMVPNSLDVCFVPAFNGLYTPYWNPDARGVICGLTEETTSEHIVRATLEAICFQVRDILEAMKKDRRGNFSKLLVNGGVTSNTLFLQVLADLLGVTIIPSKTTDSAALGAALVAYKVIEPTFNIEAPLGTATDLVKFEPVVKRNQRDLSYLKWKKAIEHSLNWDAHAFNKEIQQ